jgi:hypothetical protein
MLGDSNAAAVLHARAGQCSAVLLPWHQHMQYGMG